MENLEASKKFTAGAKVRIADTGYIYSEYEWWAAKYLKTYEQYSNWRYAHYVIDSGDTGTVICVEPHGNREDVFIAAVKVDGKKIIMIDVDGLSLLEEMPFDDTFIPGDEPFDVHEEEKDEHIPDKISYTCSFDGTSLSVEALGRRVTRDVTEILDQMVAECVDKSSQICEGDMVRIMDRGYVFPSYRDFVHRHMCFEQACCWQFCRYPQEGWVGKVLFVRNHLEFDGTKIAAVEITDGSDDSLDTIYLIDVRGLKKVVIEECEP